MRFSEHPILKGPSPEAIKKLCFNDDGSTKPEGLKALVEMHRQHEDAIANADADPLNFGVSAGGLGVCRQDARGLRYAHDLRWKS